LNNVGPMNCKSFGPTLSHRNDNSLIILTSRDPIERIYVFEEIIQHLSTA